MTTQFYRKMTIALLSILLGLVLLKNTAEVLNLQHVSHVLWPLNDSDDWLRMTQVRDWLGGGSFYDHTVHHTNAPYGGGISIHWTRPMDMLLAFFAWLLPVSFNLDQKILLAATFVPPLLGVATFFSLYWAARRAGTARNSLFLLALIAFFDTSLQYHFMPGSADHHALQIALWSLTIACCARRPTVKDAVMAGLFLSLSLWVSVEALFPIAWVYIAFGLYAVIDPARLRAFAALCTSVALFSCAALFIEMPQSQILSHVTYDSISIVHIVLLSLVAGTVLLLIPAFTRMKTLYSRLISAAISTIPVAVIMYGLFPDFFHGPMADADPALAQYLFARVQEAHPFFASSATNMLWILPLPLVALCTLVPILWKRRIRWIDAVLTLFFVAATALINVQIRWFYYLFPISIVIILARLPVVMRFYGAKYPRYIAIVSPLQRAVIFTFACILSCAVIAKSLAAHMTTPAQYCDAEIPYLLQTGAVQDALGKNNGTLYLTPSFGGETHFFTQADTIVAGYYHREVPGLRDTLRIAEARTFESALPFLQERHVTALLVCPAAYPASSWLHHLDETGVALPNALRAIPLAEKNLREETPKMFALEP